MGGTSPSQALLAPCTLHFQASPQPLHGRTLTLALLWAGSRSSAASEGLTSHPARPWPGLCRWGQLIPLQPATRGGPSYRAISHLLTSKPLFGMLPMPLWGSLLVNVFRKWI